MGSRWGIILLLLSIVLFSSACGRQRRNDKANYRLLHNDETPYITIIGSPDVKKDVISKDSCNLFLIPYIRNEVANQVLIRSSYVVSYNQTTKCPNWVAWHLTSEHTDGVFPRDNSYYEDEDVPSPRATNEDYRGSGWSRGHMCPAGDNKWDGVAMRESNLLTNMCPQHASLNSGVWNVIENDCRKWARKFGDVYIVCGPVLLNKEHETIGANKVVVPEAFFKVVLRMNPQPAAIGFIIRNNEGKKKRDQFINTIDDVERITGMDFFPALPDDIENKVEAYANINDWK